MKRSILIFLFLIASLISFSQSPGYRYGGHFGLGTTKFEFANPNQTALLSYTFGIAASKQFTQYFALNSNILLTRKGGAINGATTYRDFLGNTKTYTYTDTYHLYYVEVPVLAKLSVGFDNFYIKGFAGPSFNVHIFANERRDYDDNYYSNNNYKQKLRGVEVIEVSGIAGLGFEVEDKVNNVFFLDFRFSNGFTPAFKIADTNLYNKYFSVGFGYLY